ncbi:tRNA (N(6)-L-threonylcarbamoyladenosine(37)-C(2))-methylthiotransferase MtaB [Patescibacteria group bacterium]|nr:tRNA (N(6)-L-threonylcarbamoyladenosine(37)-C(2))-methylthiotransferase MtaB [Patescibacteria group bacterium]
MKIHFHTFGCKLNQAETEELEEKFKVQNWQIVDKTKANIHFINACVVTQKAEKEVRQLIHLVKRKFPNCFLVVAGCFTPEMKVKEKQNVDLWLNNSGKERINELILEKLYKFNSSKDIQKRISQTRTRALIKIQSGCQHYCAYCIVPFLRKKVVSRLVKNIIQEIKKKEKQGYQEIVLVGTNIGLYSDPKKSLNLTDLLKEILTKTSISRIRLSSLWPTNINSELISLIKKSPRICPHFHLSVQSASDKILKRMNRQYTRADLEKIIKKIYQIPNVNLTTDIIVGFPGETDSDFTQTMEFVQKSKILKVHVFRFSPRPKTKAADFKEQISEQAKQIRSRELIKLGEKVSQQRRKDFLDKQFSVLIEALGRSPTGEAKQGTYWQGLTSNYLKIFVHPVRSSRQNCSSFDNSKFTSNGVQSDEDLSNQIIKVKLTELYQDGIRGEIKSFV